MLPTDCKKTLLPFLCPLFSGCAPSVLYSIRAGAGQRAGLGAGAGARRPGSWRTQRAGAVPGLCAGVGAGAAARAGLAAVASGAQRAEVLRGAGERVPRERGLAAGSERDGG